MAHRVEYAPSRRSTCRTCSRGIKRGELRVAEEFLSEYSKDSVFRFHHLECAADSLPYVLRPALKATELEIPDRADLERRMSAALVVTDASQQGEGTAAEYANFVALINADPDDETAPLVFADWLQSVSDPRGELIILQQAIEQAEPGERRSELRRQEKDLMRKHRRSILPDLGFTGSLSWRTGFVHRVEINAGADVIPERLAQLWSHPSLLLIRELVVDLGRSWVALLPAPNLGFLPNSLALLDVDVGNNPIGAISKTIETAPRLISLRLTGHADIENLAHSSLTELEIHVENAGLAVLHQVLGAPRSLVERLGNVAADSLPALERLSVLCGQGADDVAHALATNKAFSRLTHLEIGGDLSGTGVDALVSLLSSREPLTELDISSNTHLSVRDRQRLSPLCAELVAPKTDLVRRLEITGMPTPIVGAEEAIGEWQVRHLRRPEWGVGVVVEELDDKLVIEFEHAGTKTIRGTELLEDV